MYDDFGYALEDAFDEGYYQALLDMGIDPEDIAEEDVDIFDDNYFDEAMEGNKFNKAMKNGVIRASAEYDGVNLSDERKFVRSGSSWDRNVGRRTPSADRERRLDGDSLRSRKRNIERDITKDYAQTVRRNAEAGYKKGKITPDDTRKFDKREAKIYHTNIAYI